MNDLETCREQILSEDTRDFISNPLRTPLFNELLKKDPCTQDAGLGYQCIYFSKELVEPISLARFSYNSIPNCFAPVAIEPDRHPSRAELSGTSIKRKRSSDWIS